MLTGRFLALWVEGVEKAQKGRDLPMKAKTHAWSDNERFDEIKAQEGLGSEGEKAKNERFWRKSLILGILRTFWKSRNLGLVLRVNDFPCSTFGRFLHILLVLSSF